MKKQQESMSLKTTTALVIIVLLVGIGGTMWYYALYQVAYMQIYDVEVKTSENKVVGFNADPTLHFGKIPAEGGIAKKNIVLYNDWDIPLKINIKVKGDVAQFISVDDNNFMIGPGEKIPVTFYATVPPGFGKVDIFTGEAKVAYLRP